MAVFHEKVIDVVKTNDGQKYQDNVGIFNWRDENIFQSNKLQYVDVEGTEFYIQKGGTGEDHRQIGDTHCQTGRLAYEFE